MLATRGVVALFWPHAELLPWLSSCGQDRKVLGEPGVQTLPGKQAQGV